MFKAFFLQAAILLLISSCAKSGDHHSEVQVGQYKTRTCAPESELLTAGIVGGTRVTEIDADSKNVMMLFVNGELCTASAISPRVILTAAHCITATVEKSWVGLYSSLSCESGFDSRYNTIKIKEFVVHPNYNKNPVSSEYSTNDLALVFLDEALPIAYPIYRIANSGDVTDKNSIYFWGYGDTTYKGGGAGILRKTEMTNQKFKILPERKKIRIDQPCGNGICQGDSGGPGLVKINHELQILGINSYVSGVGTPGSRCGSEAYLTLADAFLPWIDSTMHARNEFLKK